MPSNQAVPQSRDGVRSVNNIAQAQVSPRGELSSTGTRPSRGSAVVHPEDLMVGILGREAVSRQCVSPKASSSRAPSPEPPSSQSVANQGIVSTASSMSLIRELLSCKLSGEIMREPVLDYSDGWVYERSVIVAHLEAANREGRLPTQMMEDRIAALMPDYHLTDLARDFVASSDDVESSSDDEAPDYLCCPIMFAMMTEPVVASDGRLYERSTVERLFAEGKPSSYSREPLTSSVVRHNPLQRAIACWHHAQRTAAATALPVDYLSADVHVELVGRVENVVARRHDVEPAVPQRQFVSGWQRLGSSLMCGFCVAVAVGGAGLGPLVIGIAVLVALIFGGIVMPFVLNRIG